MAKTVPDIDIEGKRISVRQAAFVRIGVRLYVENRMLELETGATFMRDEDGGSPLGDALDLLERLIATSREAVVEKRLIAKARELMEAQSA